MILKLYNNGNSPQDLKRVTDVLDQGGIVVLPTDTVYALACNALKERAVEQICRLKGIDPKKNHLSIICYDLSTVSRYVRLDDAAFRLLKRNLPGPFTFILPATRKLPKIFQGRREVGIRMPDNPIAMAVAAAVDAPLMVSSVPLREGLDEAYVTVPELIDEQMGTSVDLVIDGGEGGTEGSTVIDCTGTEPVIVRAGAKEPDLG